LNNIFKFIKSKEQLQAQGGLWLLNTEEIVEVIASSASAELLEITGSLVSLWEKGVYIGSPKKIFENFRLIQSEKLRMDVKREFHAWYKSMKKINPKLASVEWS
jgi:hypothetical protein